MKPERVQEALEHVHHAQHAQRCARPRAETDEDQDGVAAKHGLAEQLGVEHLRQLWCVCESRESEVFIYTYVRVSARVWRVRVR